jgi:Cellulase (glycosyl hydrolase family 5)
MLFYILALLGFTVVNPVFAFDELRLTEKESFFTVKDKTVPVISVKYIGWRANWKWSKAQISSEHHSINGSYLGSQFKGDIPGLDVLFDGTVKVDQNKATWVYNWDKKQAHSDAIGFGLEFGFMLDSPTYKSSAESPELLPDNQGWRWQAPDGQAIEVKFTPALAKVYFERQKKNKIRTLFFTSISEGTAQVTMTVTVKGKNTRISGPAELNYADIDSQKWHPDILSERVSPIDLSFLNKNDLPAGKHGFVKAQADQLVFQDGSTPVKFWGANLMANALFGTSDAEINAHAKRIAQLGFNLIRIHHHDSPWVKQNIFKNQQDNTQELSDEAFKKLDWWIKCLKDQGIYIWLDLHVGRAFTEKDAIADFEELPKAKGKKNSDRAGIKGFNYYNESIQKQMQRFNEAYLNHVNSFTDLAYKDDPAIMALLVTNENDLSHHFGNALLPNKGVPKHNAIFTNDAKQFAQINGLSSNKVWHTWEMGEPKIYLSDVEHRFNQKMLPHLRSLGTKSMLATTNSWGKMEISGLPSLTDGDLIDAHSYGNAEEFSLNPRYNPGFLTWLGAAQVTAMPLSVTEWNMGSFPVVDRYTMPLYTASIANLQGWDAMMLYGYSQAKLDRMTKGSNFSSYNDPAIIGLMPAAALLYRQNHVSPAKQNYELKLSKDDFFYKKQDPTTSATIRTLLETSRFTVTVPATKELPWLKNKQASAKASIVTDANKDFIPEGQNFVQSDTGELKRDWEKGIHTINTPKSQIASGWIGGKAIKLDEVTFNVDTKNAVVAVQSLDDKALKNSKHIFITAMARSILLKNNKLPFLSEPVTGTIALSAPSGLTLYPINRLGEREAPMKASYQKGSYQLKFDGSSQSHWYVLTTD